MPKKMGVNTKAEAARARKSAVETEKNERESREKEEQYWREAESSKSRAAKKKEEDAEKRAEASTLDEAIAQMTINNLPPDRHPERRLKASFKIEDSQADIAILLRKLIRDEIRAGKTDEDVFKKLEKDFGETVLYTPKFDLQTAALWLSPLIVAGAAAGVWAYQKVIISL